MPQKKVFLLSSTAIGGEELNSALAFWNWVNGGIYSRRIVGMIA